MEFSIYLDAGSRRKVTRYFHSAWWLRFVSESPVRMARKEEFVSAKSTRASFASPRFATSWGKTLTGSWTVRRVRIEGVLGFGWISASLYSLILAYLLLR